MSSFFDMLLRDFHGGQNGEVNPLLRGLTDRVGSLDFSDPRTMQRVAAMQGFTKSIPQNFGAAVSNMYSGAASGAKDAQAYRSNEQTFKANNLALSQSIARINFYRQRAGMKPLTFEDLQKGNVSLAPDAVSQQPSMPAVAVPEQEPVAVPKTATDIAHSLFPARVVTSTIRSQAHNDELPGSVPNSMHVPGHGGTAEDFVPPPGVTLAQAAAKINALGIPGVKAIPEPTGGTGPHVHVQAASVPSPVAPQAAQASSAIPPELEDYLNQIGMFDPEKADELRMQTMLKQRQNMTPEEVVAAGYRKGTVVSSDIYGNRSVEQASDLKSPERQQQDVEAARASAQARADAVSQFVMDDASARLTAEQYLQGDKTALNSLGIGTVGSINRAKVRKYITEIAKESGLSGKDIAMRIAEFAGITAGERTLGTRTAAIGLASTEAQLFAKYAQDASDNVPRSKWKLANEAIQLGQTQLSDPLLKKLVVASISLSNAYARAISPTGVPHVEDQKLARRMLSEADGPEAYNAAVEQILLEIEGAKNAPRIVKDEMRKLGIDDRKGDSPYQPPVRVGSEVGTYNSKTGKIDYH